MKPVELGMLDSLDALLQAGSVTGAARKMGLSTPAMSHALARLRERLEDPLLVRAGRGMVLTPRAEALRERVHAALLEARRALAPEPPLVARELSRSFVVHASDYILSILGLAVDRRLRAEAPKVSLRFVPNSPDDPARLREGGSDLAVGIYGALPPELRSRPLLTDRFVCVVRRGHPLAEGRLALEPFVRALHVQVAPRGQPGGYLDEVLRERGVAREVARAVPYFLSALQLAAETDYVLTTSERLATRYATSLGLEVLEPPVKLRPYALSLLWHPRFDGDAAHRLLRRTFLAAARECAATTHDEARTRLDEERGAKAAFSQRGRRGRRRGRA